MVLPGVECYARLRLAATRLGTDLPPLRGLVQGALPALPRPPLPANLIEPDRDSRQKPRRNLRGIAFPSPRHSL